MPVRLLLVLPVVIPIAVATLLAVVRTRFGRVFLDAVATLTAGLVTALGVLLVQRTDDHRLVTWLGGWQPRQAFSVGIPFVADRISAGLVLLIGALVTATFVFSWRYFDSAEGVYHPIVLVFCGAMCGFSLTGDVFDMFVFFELMGAVAYALTGYKTEEERPLVGAVNFGIINSLGAFCTLIGIGVVYARTGQLSFAGLGAALRHTTDALVVISFVLIATGWLVKAAVLPFHFWTADAEAVAPTPVCVLFSGAMVELGLYGVARLYWEAYEPALPHPVVRFTLLCFGAATALVAGVMCFLQHHLKRLLAYSTICHVGLMLMGIAVVSHDALAGAAVYALGHAGAKGALFLCSGVLLQRFATVSESHLHGLGRRLPVVAVVWFVGGLGLAGLPPFATGLGKSLMEDSAIKHGYLWPSAVYIVGGLLTGGAVLRVGVRVFLGVGTRSGGDVSTEAEAGHRETETGQRGLTPVMMVVPAAVLAFAALAIGLIPGVAHGMRAAAEQLTDRAGYTASVLRPGPSAVHQPPVDSTWFTTLGLATATLSGGLAVVAAALAVWSPRLPGALQRGAKRVTDRPLNGLRDLHSGHVGDYAAWLMVGVAFLGGGLMLALHR